MHRHEAAKLLTYCLAQDLAYGTKIMEREAARDLAEGFLSNFDADVKFLANTRRFCDDFEGSYFSWEPISRATIDTGVLVEANGVAGILWVEDMD